MALLKVICWAIIFITRLLKFDSDNSKIASAAFPTLLVA